MDGDKNFDFVNVAIRIKPSQSENPKSIKVISKDPPVIIVPEKQVTYAFDHIFSGEEPSQEVVYNQMVKPLLNKVIHGYNSTIFAYGQTGTGKTYTIGTDPSCYDNIDAGLITRALNDVMTFNENHEVDIHISFYEIYNERVYDLLTSNKAALAVKGFNINGLTKHRVESSADARHLLMEGGKNRHTGETKQNSKSSRSHAIFTIYCKVKHLNHAIETKLNLVDLAGSESVKKTGNEGSQFHEGININKGLLCIGQVINALSNNHAHVPYRQSTITTILQDSLNKKNYVTLIACVGTYVDDLTETVQTLDFAQRAKRLRNRPELNSIIGEYAATKTGLSTRTTPMKSVIPFTPSWKPSKFRTPFRPTTRTNQRKTQTNLLATVDSRTYNDDATSMLSGSISTVSTAHELPSLSPIIKTCIDAVENRFIARLTTIVGEIATPMQRVDSPRFTGFSRRSLQREVHKIIQSKMCLDPQFCTFRNEINCNGDTNAHCSDDNDGATKADQTLDGDMDGSVETSMVNSVLDSPHMFKKPMVPMQKRRGRKSTATSSPILGRCSPLKQPRRSMRLSSIRAAVVKSPIALPVRRSRRITNIMKTEPVPSTPKHKPKSKATKLTPIKKRKVSEGLIDVSHTKKVLKVINAGSVKDIMELNTVGAKGAAMMHQFRQLKGRVRKIADLRLMPWRGDGYQRFVDSNFLVPNTP